MREIKFRAWHSGSMSPVHWTLTELMQAAIRTQNVMDEETVWMQYTGHKDKNGKKIFDQDILSKNDYQPKKVYWLDELAAWQIPNDSDKWEIVGNAYENPELLK